MKSVELDPMYLMLRDIRQEADIKQEVDFSQCPLALKYPLPEPLWAPSWRQSAARNKDQSSST